MSYKLESRVRRNINSLIYADDTTLMAESKEQLKKLLMRVKDESKIAGLRLNIKKKKKLRSWHLAPLLMANRRGKGGSSEDFLFLVSKITAEGDCSHEIGIASWQESYGKSRQ